jgi:hypothetical protein
MRRGIPKQAFFRLNNASLIYLHKIPTMVAYRDGKPELCGAEAIDYFDEEEYHLAQWFKVSSFDLPCIRVATYNSRSSICTQIQ